MNRTTQPKDLWSPPAGSGSAVWQAVEDILSSGRQVGVATTGGGSRAVTWLLDHAGASAAIVEVCIPYGAAALSAYLAQPGPHRVEAETARRLACRARDRLVALGGEPVRSMGLGCTAALTTIRRRRGADRGHIVCRGADEYLLCDVGFDRESARQEQEAALSAVLVSALRRAVGHDGDDLLHLPAWARLQQWALPAHAELEELLDGRRQELWWRRGGAPVPAHEEMVLISGSFNPLHRGHTGMAAAAARRSGRAAVLELSVVNVDKPPLAYVEVLRRLEALPGDLPVVVTRAATFPEKARLFPGAWYAIGCDTAVRLLEPGYYKGSVGGLDEALDELVRHRAHFIVAGRAAGDRFGTLADLSVPPRWSALLTGLSESEFRLDLSSTDLRGAANSEGRPGVLGGGTQEAGSLRTADEEKV